MPNGKSSCHSTPGRLRKCHPPIANPKFENFIVDYDHPIGDVANLYSLSLTGQKVRDWTKAQVTALVPSK
jgi:hypothetical protein